jgi:hypothetical protein
MNAHADNRGPENTPVKHVPVLKDVEDKSVGMIYRFGALDGLVHVRIECFAGGIDALNAVARKSIPELFADESHALAILLVSRIVVRLERSIKSIEDGNQISDQALDAAAPLLVTVALDALPVIFEVGLPADKRLLEIFFFGAKRRDLRGEG